MKKIAFCSYSPGRFAYLMDEPFAKQVWEYLSDDKQVYRMIAATEKNIPAIQPLLPEIETRFGEYLSSPEFPGDDVMVMVNNMIKQLLEMRGYEHFACGICRDCTHFKSSGLYKKNE